MTNLITNQRFVGLLLLLLSGAYLWFIQDIPLDFWSETEPFNARTMPYLYGYAGLIVASLLIITPSSTFDWSRLKNLSYFPAICLLLLLTAYGWCIEYLGFITSTTLLLSVGFLLLGERRFLAIVLVALGLSFVFYFGMDLLDIYLSPGELWS